MPLSSITPNTLKTAEELLLSLRGAAPHIQTAGMAQPAEKVMPNQSLEMVLLLCRTKTNLRSATTDSQPVSTLEVGIIGLLLRETI